MSKLNRLALSVLATGVLVLAAWVVLAHGNMQGRVKATIGKANVTIEYNRPSLKGRDMLKKIHPGDLWRIGSDDPTTLESDVDLDFGGTRVPKGKHILLARLVEPGKWLLIVSRKSVFEYQPSAKIAEVPMELQESKDSAEMVTIQLSNKGGRGVIEIAWGTARLIASFAPAS